MKYFKLLLSALCALTLFGCGGSAGETAKINAEQDMIKNIDLWATPELRPEGFLFEIQSSQRAYQAGIGENATEYNSASGQERAARAEEWGYSMCHLDGITDGCGRSIVSPFREKPSSKAQAVEMICKYLDDQYKSISVSGVMYSMNGHYPWHHYAGEAGFDVLGSEIGENINSYQWHLALNRGAARQYRTPWFVDFSSWHGASVLDYSENSVWGSYGSPDGGHSLSLFERSMLISYMAGADSLVVEAGDIICFTDQGDLSPMGEVCKKLYAFFKSLPERGSSYTPFALVLDYYHGTYGGSGEKLSFNSFEWKDGDYMTRAIVRMLWPGGFEIAQGGNEKGTLANSRYGDVFDVVLDNAPFDVLDSYPVLIFSGDMEYSAENAEKYERYVQNGGIILANTRYKDMLSWAAECENVIFYGPDYLLSQQQPFVESLGNEILKLSKALIPFEIDGNVEYAVNIAADKIYLTLINNDGVAKYPGKPVKINESKTSAVKIAFTGNYRVESVCDIYNNLPVEDESGEINLTLGPGGIGVLEYRLSNLEGK